jgi:AmmeMemoRadiSam system protein A
MNVPAPKDESLSPQERRLLLDLARQSIERAVCGMDAPLVEVENLPPTLRADGVCFVTLTTRDGALRGCIGALEARQPLALDVCEHAAAAALEDYRFLPVTPSEVPMLHIEISRLTTPRPLSYQRPTDLPNLLHPHRDGVVLREGQNRATFLPQVWDKISDPCAFLTYLCQKMGAPGDLWQRKILTVEIYTVEEFEEFDE